MFYREMQDNVNVNMNMETQEIDQQQMPMGQPCPYLSQGMCMNPNMMYQQSNQQPMTGQMGYPMDYNYPQQDQGNLSDYSNRDSDDSRQFGWGGYPYGGYPYGGFPYGGYYGGYYGHGGHGHH
ncbi:MAG: hypothetical protein H7Y18_21015 [Clostridiaceae bacterium]|nr:hypothetical protein [Clostridiaceae bacterium]